MRLSGFPGSLRACAFFVAIPTGARGDAGDGGGAAWVRFCVIILALWRFPRRVRWGSAPQTCAKESSTLWTLFTLRRGCLRAYTRRHPGTRKDPSGSDLWPVRSCCIVLSFLALRGSKWNRHCRRAAPKRRGVGLRARSGEETALRSPPSAEESGCVREAVGMQTQFAGPTNANDGLAVSTARIASLTES